MTEQIKYTSMGSSLDDVLGDFKIVEDSIYDERTFQKADSGLVLSVLSDAIKYLEEYKKMKSAWEEVLNELEETKEHATDLVRPKILGRKIKELTDMCFDEAIRIINKKLSKVEDGKNNKS